MAREKGMGNLQLEKSGRWTMRVGINGKRYCRSTRTKDKDKAERILQRFLAPFGLGECRLPLADVWNAYVMSPDRNELALTTLESKRIVWLHFARWMEHYYLFVKDLNGVTHEMIGEYLALLRTQICASTYNGRVCVLREIFRTLAAKAGLEEDPWMGVKLRPCDSHSRRELSIDELHRLIDSASKVGNDGSEWKTLFLIGIYTGLRLGDCCRLDWSNISLSKGIIQLMPAKTKRHHQRIVTIPIHPTLRLALINQYGLLGDFSSQELSTLNLQNVGPVLPVISKMYTHCRWQVSHKLSSIFKDAKVVTSVRIEGRRCKAPDATFHSLRHTFVSFSANAGIPLHIVQSIVGHESTAMTRHYYHENLEALQQAVNAIPAI